MLTPTTALGRWSVLAAVTFGLLVLLFIALVASGERGGQEFFDNLWLAIPGLTAYAAGVVAFVTGAAAISTRGERSLAAIAATALGFLVTAWGVLEVAFPH